jgi:hypothetical protein
MNYGRMQNLNTHPVVRCGELRLKPEHDGERRALILMREMLQKRN